MVNIIHQKSENASNVNCRIYKLIKSSVIAIFDIDEQFLIIRNCSNLPFVQIHERRQFFRINDIEKLEYDRQVKIYVNYISKHTNKKVEAYLYSIVDGIFKSVV